MKNILPCLFVFLVSCSQKSNKVGIAKGNDNLSQQKEFANFLSSFGSLSTTNELRTKELIDSFNVELEKKLDSIPVFYNWEGVVKDIDLDQTDGYSIVTFRILYETNRHGEIEFNCSHTVKTKDAFKDSIYQTLKNSDVKQTVYIDGFIEREINDQVKYDEFLLGEFERAQFPRYKFKAIDLRKTPKPDYPSKTLELGNVYNSKIFSLLRKYTLKKISEADWKRKTKSLADTVATIQQKLNGFELEIEKRTRQQMANSFQAD